MNEPLQLEKEREKKVRKAPKDITNEGIPWQRIVSCVFGDHEIRVIFS